MTKNKPDRISTILFDIGGVYMKGDVTDFINDSYKALGIDKKISLGNRIAINDDLNKGLITAEECFREFFGVPINDEQMENIIGLWTSNWKTTDKMTNLVNLLKKSYTVAALSNSDEANAKILYKDGTYSQFDYVFLSHEMGIIKPDEEIYIQAVDILGVAPNECLFIDDQKKCLAPARKMGMKTILFKDYGQLEKDLEEMGIRGRDK